MRRLNKLLDNSVPLFPSDIPQLCRECAQRASFSPDLKQIRADLESVNQRLEGLQNFEREQKQREKIRQGRSRSVEEGTGEWGQKPSATQRRAGRARELMPSVIEEQEQEQEPSTPSVGGGKTKRKKKKSKKSRKIKLTKKRKRRRK